MDTHLIAKTAVSRSAVAGLNFNVFTVHIIGGVAAVAGRFKMTDYFKP